MKLGIDLGGAKIEITAMDDKGVELLRRRVPTPQQDYQATCGPLLTWPFHFHSEQYSRGTRHMPEHGSKMNVDKEF
jgi:hypothetical protein